MIFRGENFHRLLNCAAKKAMSANFVARMFGNSYKTSKNFFSLERFLLYVCAGLFFSGSISSLSLLF